MYSPYAGKNRLFSFLFITKSILTHFDRFCKPNKKPLARKGKEVLKNILLTALASTGLCRRVSCIVLDNLIKESHNLSTYLVIDVFDFRSILYKLLGVLVELRRSKCILDRVLPSSIALVNEVDEMIALLVVTLILDYTDIACFSSVSKTPLFIRRNEVADLRILIKSAVIA